MFTSLVQFFTPKGKILFFPLFDRAAENVVAMAELLKKRFVRYCFNQY